MTTDPALTQAEVRAVVGGALLGMFLAALDQTIVATALPPIARDLGGFELISWVVTGYLVTATCATPIIGKLSDLYGRRQMLAFCLVVFLVGSTLCALATGMVALILARILQGIGGGGLITMGQTIIGEVVAPRERGRYAGYFSILWASSSLLGPILGGLLTEHYGWQLIFWINLPIGLVALVVTDRALRHLRFERRPARVDLLGIPLLTGATVALLLVLSLGGKILPWGSPALIALGAATLLLGLLFVGQQARAAEPIVPPRFLRDRVIAPVLGSIFIVYGAYLALAILAPIYLQVALGRPVSETGLLMIPLLLSSTLTANVAGWHSRRVGRYKLPPLVSLPITIASVLLLAVLADRVSAPVASLILMVAGCGLGPIFPCTTVAAQNAVERGELGAVSGANGFARALGGAVLIAAASSLVLGLLAHALPQAGVAGSLEDLSRLSLNDAARAVVARAFGTTFAVLAGLMLVGLGVFALVEDRVLRGAGEPAPRAAD